MKFCKNEKCKYYNEDICDKGYRVYDEKPGVCTLNNDSGDNLLHNDKCIYYEKKLISKALDYIKFK